MKSPGIPYIEQNSSIIVHFADVGYLRVSFISSN